MITNFDELIKHAQAQTTKKLVVAAAEDDVVLKAVKMAADLDLIEPVLIGDEQQIRNIAGELGIEIPWKIINEPDKRNASALAVKEIAEGRGEILMKGLVGTPILLKAVLNKEVGLAVSKVLSHVGLIGVSTYPKLIIMTDGGMVPYPNLVEKGEILKNAIRVARGLGISPIRAAIVSSLETVSDKVTSTIDAAALAKMGDRKQFGKDVIVDGPLALDNAISAEAAKHKGIVSDVAGQPDILIMPNVEAGNIFYKTLVYLGNCKAETAGIVLGAKVPVIVPSRTDTAESKMNAIAASVLIAGVS
ncbi:MAG TPA: bifunctional enoyl-CoA hydratase/phosphate acetyltransferase [Caldisericia bacterium]|nr:bifunctional enoyl-CoA hydratase/phosphate acetyltransferase [Caldisericia bacterium]HPF48461.1 bifunctional enoyl-CoA hydratase/phosphate acetyltransferase [Caldisericia bacterium]HPI83359.1 bifunctional enoyl-CoA hydratase/phosphate acetyltransferase [Caldisericia bacterium]HPQ92915.1 bifunctional enoyl-CoA hydratase/phosphate acetyltransferase [Caldisericia bacterium]HRV73987.1 bifunctional enoyl-CoA hydratase/phosphate acetyltransferase [Caldisericia bacterium]